MDNCDSFRRAMVRVEALLTQGLRLAFENPELSERHMLDALAVANEWNMPAPLRKHIAENAAMRMRQAA